MSGENIFKHSQGYNNDQKSFTGFDNIEDFNDYKKIASIKDYGRKYKEIKTGLNNKDVDDFAPAIKSVRQKLAKLSDKMKIFVNTDPAYDRIDRLIRKANNIITSYGNIDWYNVIDGNIKLNIAMSYYEFDEEYNELSKTLRGTLR